MADRRGDEGQEYLAQRPGHEDEDESESDRPLARSEGWQCHARNVAACRPDGWAVTATGTGLTSRRACRRKCCVGHALPLLLPQPHTRRVAIGKLDAGLFEHALDRREIIAHRHATSLLEVDDDAARDQGAISQRPLIHLDEAARGAALGWRNRHVLIVKPYTY